MTKAYSGIGLSTHGLYSQHVRRLMDIGIHMINLRRSDEGLMFIIIIPAPTSFLLVESDKTTSIYNVNTRVLSKK